MDSIASTISRSHSDPIQARENAKGKHPEIKGNAEF